MCVCIFQTMAELLKLDIVELQAAHYFNYLRKCNKEISAYHSTIPHWGKLPQSVKDVWLKFIPKILENTLLFYREYNRMPTYDGKTLYDIYAICAGGKSAVSGLPLIAWPQMIESATKGWELLAIEYNKDTVTSTLPVV